MVEIQRYKNRVADKSAEEIFNMAKPPPSLKL